MKNELIKIFKKKSIYITLFVILAFVILTNCIYKFFYYTGNYEEYSDTYIQYNKEEIAKLDPNKPSDTKMYIDLKTTLDIYDMKQKYEANSWQRSVLSEQVGSQISERNTYLYGENKDSQKVAKIEEEINQTLTKLDQGDWRYFAKNDLEEAKIKLKNLEEQKAKTEDKQELQSLEIGIQNAKVDEEVAQIRMDKDISYGNDFRNKALNTYQSEAKNVINRESNTQELDYAGKQDKNESIEKREISRYIIENNVDINKSNDVRGILKNLFNEYGLFIIVMIVMIAGTIVSEEFNKGTIKLLLVKPYDRRKILLAKFITVLIMILFSIAVVVIMELIVGGIIFGWNSLSVPILQYNFDTQSLENIPIFTYLGIEILTQLPKLILLATLAFSCSTLFTNSAVAIAIPLLGYMSADMINMLVIQYKVEFMKFFVSLNWDFKEYLFGKLPTMEGLTLGFSIIICSLYFVAMLIPTFIAFKKKNIKNI
jgi:ABC-2 type transport system permease protein